MMESRKIESLRGRIRALVETDKDFPQKLKQRLVFECKQMANHSQFIGAMLSKGVLCNEANHSEENFTLKEMMIQLLVTIACSRGVDAIADLIESLEESGNLDLFATILSGFKEDVGFVADGDWSPEKKVDSIAKASTSERSAKNPNDLSSSAINFVDKIMLHEEPDFMRQLEDHLVGKASEIISVQELCTSLVKLNVLEETDTQMETGPQVQEVQLAEKAMKAACSMRAMGSLVKALQHSDNQRFLQETTEWLETVPLRQNHHPVAVKSLANQLSKEQRPSEKHTLFNKPAPSSGIEKIATFNCHPGSSSSGGTFSLEFDKDRMIACSTPGTMSIWNWLDDQEKKIEFGSTVKDITWFQCDEEIAVLGTAAGTVHLLDVTTLEGKSTVRLHGPVKSLKFVESTVVVLTDMKAASQEIIWWIDIFRGDMQLRNQRTMGIWARNNTNIIFFMDSQYTALCGYLSYDVQIYHTKSGEQVFNNGEACSLHLYASISTLSVVDLIATKTNFIAGCKDGYIAVWGSCKFQSEQCHVKNFHVHTKEVVGLCGMSGHLLSLDESGELLMWCGQDLENESTAPLVRVLAKSFCHRNVTSLFAYERWFASSSSKDGVVNIWTIPELWLRTG